MKSTEEGQQDRRAEMTSGLRGSHDQVDVTGWEENQNAVITNDLISFRSPDEELRGPHNSGQGAQATAQVLADTAMKLRSWPQSAQDTSQVLADTVRRLTALLSTLTPDGSIYEGASKLVNGKQPKYHVGQDTDAGTLMYLHINCQ